MIILQGITVEELLLKIEAIIDKKLDERLTKETKPEIKLFTRKEASEFLRISLPTLSEWTKLGLIPSYRIGRRVYYKSSDIETGLTGRKYRKL